MITQKRINRSRIDKWNRKIHGPLVVTKQTYAKELHERIKVLTQQFVAARLSA